jgi:uncharacterized protein
MFSLTPFKKIVSASLMLVVSLGVAASLRSEDIALKDGRIFTDAEIISQAPLTVMIKHRGGLNSVPKQLLPEKLAAQFLADPKAVAEAKAASEKAAADAKAKEISRSKTRELAESGDAGAQFAVGSMYFMGDGVPKNFTEASTWYRRAAEGGNEMAQYTLGRMYDAGHGVPKNFLEAAKWYRKAAEQDNSEAQYGLGVLLEKGFGVAKDSAEAVNWFRQSAEQGNVAAQKKMVVFFLHGDGVPRDVVEALAWLNVVAASGDREAKQLRDELDAVSARNPSLVLRAQQRSSQIFNAITANRSRRMSAIQRSNIAPPEAAGSKGNGSGVIVSSSGYVLTAAHVVLKAAKVVVVTTLGSRKAKVVSFDEANDVALLKLESGTYPSLPVIPSKQIRLGQSVATIGFPIVDIQGFSPKVTRGEISSMNGAGDDPRKWQISVPIQPGNSGGPLLDENGNVVGIVVSRLFGDGAQNVNYAVKSSYALSLLEPYAAEIPPAADGASAPPRFEDMVARAEKSAVLVLVY